MTQHVYRILILYPQSRFEEIEQWYASQFPGAGELLTPAGTKDAEQWYAASFVATVADVDKWIHVFHANLGPNVPLDFTELPRLNQRALLAGLQTAALATMGIYVDGCFNDESEALDFEEVKQSLEIQEVS